MPVAETTVFLYLCLHMGLTTKRPQVEYTTHSVLDRSSPMPAKRKEPGQNIE